MPTEFSGYEPGPSKKQIILDVSISTFNWLLALSSKLKLKGPGDAAIYCANKCRAAEEGRVLIAKEAPSVYLVREYLYANPEKTMREINQATSFSQASTNNAIRTLDSRGELVRGLRHERNLRGPVSQVFSLNDTGRLAVEQKIKNTAQVEAAKARAARPISEIVADRERLIEAFKTNLTAYALQEIEVDEHPSEEATTRLLELGGVMKGSYEALSELPTERMRIVAEVNAYIENVKAEHAEFPEDPPEEG